MQVDSNFGSLREASVLSEANARPDREEKRSAERVLRWLPLLLLIPLLLFACGSLALLQAGAAYADTRSILRADYGPWEFTVFRPVAPDIVQEILLDQEKYPDSFNEPVEPEVAPGDFWSPPVTPTPTPTPAVSPTPGTSTPTATPTPVVSDTATPTVTATVTASLTATATASPTPTASPTTSATATITNTPAPTNTATNTPAPTNTPVPPTPTNTPTDTPVPTSTPTNTPTDTPVPTSTPTNTPTDTPAPTSTPTNTPTDTPVPTSTPTSTPTDTPAPTSTPTNTPTDTPAPTSTPTDTPAPTSTPTPTPTDTPLPTATPTPTSTPGAAGDNYRSIGTNSGTLYSTGTASINVGETVVIFGGGASLPDPDTVGAVGTGDRLVIGAETFFILSRDSATQVTVQSPAAFTHSAEAYSIMRAYNTLQAWENDRQGDLVAENRREFGVVYKDGPFNAGGSLLLVIDGSTTDAGHYMHLMVASGQRHDGTAGTGALADGGGITSGGVRLIDDYTRFEGLELHSFHSSSGAATTLLVQDAFNVLIEDLLIHDFVEAGQGSRGIRAGSGSTSSLSFTVRNSIIYNGNDAITIDVAGATVQVDNVTMYGMTQQGVHLSSGSMTVTNTISMGNTGGDFQDSTGGNLIQSFNLSSDATATGAGSLTNQVATDQFVSLAMGSQDFHLKAGANAIDAGTDLSGSFTDDIDGDSRPQALAWDMGADEFIAPPATATPTPTDTPLPTSTPTPTPTDTPLPTSTPTPTATNTPLPTSTPTPTATDTPLPTNTPTPTATDTPLPTNTPTPTTTPESTEFTMATGSYIGDGTDGRSIAGLGFQPDAVLIKVDYLDPLDASLSAAVLRTSTMVGDSTKPLRGNQALTANLIQSLDADGFTVGNDQRVNDDTVCGGPCTYYWVAFEAGPNMIVGSYAGDGSAGQSITTGFTFSPEYLFDMPANSERATHRSHLFGLASNPFNSGGPELDSITSLDASGFTVGSTYVNSSSVEYHYIAWNAVAGRIDVDTYQGNGIDNRSIGGVGFQPEYVIVQSATGGRDPIQRTASMAGDLSINFRGASNSNRIQALEADGFQIGTYTGVNEDLEEYTFVAFDGSEVIPPTPTPTPTNTPTPVPGAGKMYWGDVSANTIERSDLDGLNREDVSPAGIADIYGIDLDTSAGKMYFIDQGTAKVQRANLDGSSLEDLFTSSDGIVTLEGVAVDPIGGKVYWTDVGTSTIRRGNLDGSGAPEDLFTSADGIVAPRGIALDVANGTMYWAESGPVREVRRGNMDGSGSVTTVVSGLASAEAVALDLTARKVYWTYDSNNTIMRADMDGLNSNVEDVSPAGLDGPKDIDLDVAGGKMYFTESGTVEQIRRANLNGTSSELLVPSLGNVRGIALDP